MTTSVFQGRSFLAEKDFTRAELEYLIGLSAHLKDLKKRNIQHHYLAGKNIALLFEKTSTRTRAAFTTAAIDLGAHPEYLGANDIQHQCPITEARLILNGYGGDTPSDILSLLIAFNSRRQQ